MNNYTTRKRAKTILIIAILLIDLALAAANIIQDRRQAEDQWNGTIPMANQHITWTGAGYSSFQKGGK